MIAIDSRGFFSRWRWPTTLLGVTVAAWVLAVPAMNQPQVAIYPTTDFARLPVTSVMPPTPASPISCVSIQRVNGSPKLADETCGSPASTFRVIARVSNVSQCLRDVDLTYSSAAGGVCLDYDWAAGQCLSITKDAVSKTDCAKRGAVRPELAIIGAVDVTYCREGGIAHAARRFTICTLAGEEDCRKPKRAT